MNGYLEQYTRSEWMQIASFLIGPPVAAVVGALLGLVGKWKQGFVSTAAVYGLAGSAVSAVLVLFTFLSSSIFDFPYVSTSWMRLYDQILSQRLGVFTLAAALIVSLGWAIYLRRRGKVQAAAAITLRQLVLAQFFILIVLGCWTSMRSLAFEWSSPVEKAIYKYAKLGWRINGGVPEGKVKMEREYAPASADWKAESEMLRKVCKEPWLGELVLTNLDKADALDFGAIASAKELTLLTLRYHPVTMPPQTHFDTVAKLPLLTELTVIGGDYQYVDVTALERAPKLKKLVLHQFNCEQARLRKTIRAMELDHFAQYPQSAPPDVGVISYWQNYHAIHFYKWPVGADDLTWVAPEKIRMLQMDGSELTLEAARSIATMPIVEDMNLHCRIEGDALSEIAKCAKLKHLFCVQLEPPKDRASFDQAVDELLMSKSLKVIDWNWGVMKPELDYPPPSAEEQRLIALGKPGPQWFDRSPTEQQKTFVDQINLDRKQRGLGKLVINPTTEIRLKMLTE